MKNKLNIIFYVVIGVLTIIAGLEGLYILNHKNSSLNNKETIKYIGPNYLKENIVYNKPDDISLDAQIYRENKMLLIKMSTKQNIVNAKVNIEYFDEDNTSVKKDEVSIPILAASDDYAYNFSLPSVSSGKYAGKIVISVEKENYEEETNLYDQTLISFDATSNINEETKMTTFNLTADNPYEKINYCDGFILFYKNDMLLDVSYFNIDPISNIINNKIIVPVVLNPIAEDGKMAPLGYDDFKVVINNLY